MGMDWTHPEKARWKKIPFNGICREQETRMPKKDVTKESTRRGSDSRKELELHENIGCRQRRMRTFYRYPAFLRDQWEEMTMGRNDDDSMFLITQMLNNF
jgi:hypothetical protein